MQEIRVEPTKSPKAKPASSDSLGFGSIFTDHMFLMNYDEGQGWHDPRIVPYGPLALDPAAMCLHYGQEVFEGMKAYRTPEGKVVLFRPEKNMARLNLSNDRLCIPLIDEAFGVEAVKKLVEIDQAWIPSGEGTALYIRPFIIAVDPHVGVHPAHHLLFIIILSPVGAYYPEGINPVKICVEQKYVRAVKGGMGFTKTAGNYAASLKAQDEAEKLGYTQVLWLDGVERKYIEEVGTMNIFFKIDGKVYTANAEEQDGTVLPGVTRRSIIELLRDWGYEVVEGKLAIADIMQAARDGKLEEVFGTGTAAVVSPVKELVWKGEHAYIGDGNIGPVTQKLYDTMTGMQWGKIPDTKGWIVPVEKKY